MYDKVCSLQKIYKMMKQIIKIAVAFTLGNILLYFLLVYYITCCCPSARALKLMSPDLSGPKFCVCISAFHQW